jgi:hypothetical protein
MTPRWCDRCRKYLDPDHEHPPSLFDEVESAPAIREPEVERSAPAHRDARDTEVEAAAMIAPRAGTWRRRVLEAIAAAGADGRTDWELHGELGGNLYTVAPRRVELERDGWIADAGERRTTNNGRRAIVWRLTPAGAAQLAGEA